MRQKSFELPAMGASSLLTIFSVLCLVTFSLLSISTAQSQRSLSQTSARTVSGYYEADARAEEILSQLRAGQLPQGVDKQGEIYFYSCTISDTQQLEVEVEVTGGRWNVLRWQVVSTIHWESDDSLDVWDGML